MSVIAQIGPCSGLHSRLFLVKRGLPGALRPPFFLKVLKPVILVFLPVSVIPASYESYPLVYSGV